MFDDNAMISGQWVNRFNGNTITVRDVAMDGDDLQIITTDGYVISGTEFSENYLQVSGDEYDDKGNKISSSNTNIDYDSLFPPASPVYDFNERNVKSQNTVIPNNQKATPQIDEIAIDSKNDKQYQSTKSENISYTILEKFFNKQPSQPKIIVDCKWDNMPIDDLNSLIQMLDISEKDAVDFIINNFVKYEDIRSTIETNLKNIFNMSDD